MAGVALVKSTLRAYRRTHRREMEDPANPGGREESSGDLIPTPGTRRNADSRYGSGRHRTEPAVFSIAETSGRGAPSGPGNQGWFEARRAIRVPTSRWCGNRRWQRALRGARGEPVLRSATKRRAQFHRIPEAEHFHREEQPGQYS